MVDGPGGKLKGLSCAAPPIRAFEILKPVSAKPLKAGVAVYDLGPKRGADAPHSSRRGRPAAVQNYSRRAAE